MKNRIGYLLILSVIAISCSKKNPSVPAPGQASLTFPLQSSACITGTVLSATTSSVTFTWSAAANTSSYELDIKNLLTNVTTTQTTTTNQLPVTLLRNTPYSWFVVSKSMATAATAQSDTWKFYNSGPGIVSRPPFPASIGAPLYGQNINAINNTVNLSWTGSDVDNDITGYDVYFGTNTQPPLLASNVINLYLNSVTVTSNTVYYWKIITKDSQGNTSDSGVFQFKTI